MKRKREQKKRKKARPLPVNGAASLASGPLIAYSALNESADGIAFGSAVGVGKSRDARWCRAFDGTTKFMGVAMRPPERPVGMLPDVAALYDPVAVMLNGVVFVKAVDAVRANHRASVAFDLGGAFGSSRRRKNRFLTECRWLDTTPAGAIGRLFVKAYAPVKTVNAP